MKTINVLQHGIKNDGTPTSSALQALISSTAPATQLYFPEGVYCLESAVEICRKSDLILKGENATLVTHFSAVDSVETLNEAFVLTDCDNIEINGFTVTTDNPINSSGTVIAKDESAHTFDVKLNDEFDICGLEHIYGIDTCDAEGTPDYVIETYEHITEELYTDENGVQKTKYVGTRYEVTGEKEIRIFMPHAWDISELTVGHKILFRYAIYKTGAFVFYGCRNVKMCNIEIERAATVGVIIQPRSANFTFENFNIRVPERSSALYASNADGVHIKGLEGYLKMTDCKFKGLGDDALNIHSPAGAIGELDLSELTIKCVIPSISGKTYTLDPSWARSGDILNVYDKDTFLQKGSITLGEYTPSGDATIASYAGTLAVGDVLANSAFFASVHLNGCEVMHTRARGFLLQSQNVLVENCRIYGMALPGIIVSPDIRVWNEVGPSDNVEIRNCIFEKCGHFKNGANLGAIVVKACHDVGADDYPAGVHKNMNIHDNLFKNCGNSGIFACATSGITISNNTFEKCSARIYRDDAETPKYDIALVNCEDVNITENNTSKSESLLLYTENCN